MNEMTTIDMIHFVYIHQKNSATTLPLEKVFPCLNCLIEKIDIHLHRSLHFLSIWTSLANSLVLTCYFIEGDKRSRKPDQFSRRTYSASTKRLQVDRFPFSFRYLSQTDFLVFKNFCWEN